MIAKDKLDQLRQSDFTKLIETPIKEVCGKKQILCPMHEEDTPSFFIYADGSFHCFGCGTHGRNAIDFVMKKLACGFKEACELLQVL